MPRSYHSVKRIPIWRTLLLQREIPTWIILPCWRLSSLLPLLRKQGDKSFPSLPWFRIFLLRVDVLLWMNFLTKMKSNTVDPIWMVTSLPLWMYPLLQMVPRLLLLRTERIQKKPLWIRKRKANVCIILTFLTSWYQMIPLTSSILHLYYIDSFQWCYCGEGKADKAHIYEEEWIQGCHQSNQIQDQGRVYIRIQW